MSLNICALTVLGILMQYLDSAGLFLHAEPSNCGIKNV